MPLYDFQCKSCGAVTEQAFGLNSCPNAIKCPYCGWAAPKKISIGHGGIQTEHPVWLDDHVRGALQDDDEVAAGRQKRIENRTDYNRHLKEHGIVEKA